MAKFDSNRILPGTISFTRDATTGEFKIQQQGFLDLPDLSLPTIDQADYDTGDGTTTPPPDAANQETAATATAGTIVSATTAAGNAVGPASATRAANGQWARQPIIRPAKRTARES